MLLGLLNQPGRQRTRVFLFNPVGATGEEIIMTKAIIFTVLLGCVITGASMAKTSLEDSMNARTAAISAAIGE